MRSVEGDARKLCESGVRVERTYKSLRDAADELDARVRSIERSAKPVAPKKTAAPKTETAPASYL